MTTTHEKAEIAHEIASEAQEVKSFWRERDRRWAEVRAMIAQAYYEAKKGRENFFSNEPRALTDLGVAVLTGKDPIITMPISAEDEEELLKKSRAERLLEGAFRDIRRNWRRRARGDWFKELGWFILTGGYAVFPHLIVNDRGDVEFRADLWDPIQVYPEPGHTGMERLYRIYSTTYGMALSMARANEWDVRELTKDADKTDKGRWRDNEVLVVNKWWMEGKKVFNAVVFNDLLVKEPEHERTMRRIPVLAGPSDGVPYRDYSADKDFPIPTWQSQWGQPLIAANMDLYAQLDRLISWMMQITKDHALPTYLDINEEGTLTVNPNADMGKMLAIPRKPNEDYRPVVTPTAPREREELLAYLIGAMQRGGISHAAFGALGIEISGVTLQQLLTATRSKLLPYIQTAEDVLSETLMELLGQFKAVGRKVSLAVQNREKGPGGNYLIEDFTPDQIPESPYVKVELPLALPDDMMERIVAARQAIGTSEPLVDWRTVADRFLQIQDPELVRERLDQDIGNQHPAMVAFRTIRAMKQQAELELAKATMEPTDREFHLLSANLLNQIADATLAQVASTIAGQGGGPNAQGTPARTPEPRPQEMPPEAGPLNPDLFNVAFGRPAATPQRPTTVEDRVRNMGLVIPGR